MTAEEGAMSTSRSVRESHDHFFHFRIPKYAAENSKCNSARLSATLQKDPWSTETPRFCWDI